MRKLEAFSPLMLLSVSYKSCNFVADKHGGTHSHSYQTYSTNIKT